MECLIENLLYGKIDIMDTVNNKIIRNPDIIKSVKNFGGSFLGYKLIGDMLIHQECFTDKPEYFNKLYYKGRMLGIDIHNYEVDGLIVDLESFNIKSLAKSEDTWVVPDWLVNITYNFKIEARNISKVIFNDKIRDLPDGLFKGLEYLEYVRLPQGIKHIPNYCFMGCKSLKHVDNTETVEEIHLSAFYECVKLDSISLASVRLIESRAFEYCTSLEELKLPSIERVENRAFFNCRSVKNIEFAESIESIGSEAFSYCVSLKTIEIPKIRYIKNSAFSNTGLCEVTIHKVIDMFGDTFYKCLNLRKVVIKSANEIPSCAFNWCINLTELELPEDLKFIRYGAFGNCISLRHIVLPKKVEQVWDRAFCECKDLEYIEFPEGIDFVADRALEGCNNLRTIKFPNTELDINTIFKNQISNGCIILK